jgi:UPF0755 protein
VSSSPDKKRSKVLPVVFVAFAVIGIVVVVFAYQYFLSPNVAVRQQGKGFIIPRGATINQVVDSLLEEELLQENVSFMFVSKLLNYTERVKPGYYVFEQPMSNLEAVRFLRSGAQSPVNVTFSATRTVPQALEKLSRTIEATPEELQELLYKPETLQRLGFTKETLPAFLIPNTYEVYYTTSAEELIDRLEKEYNRFWNASRRQKAKAQGLTPVEVSTLASIVEGETKKSDERAKVAGLYLNRLKKGMLLQSDPTVKFAVNKPLLRRVLNRHLEVNSPYNTYKVAGLPPGPINVPPVQAINAVLNPDSHNYLYMVAKEDFSGYHNFSTNIAQHNRFANKYRQALNTLGIYK